MYQKFGLALFEKQTYSRYQARFQPFIDKSCEVDRGQPGWADGGGVIDFRANFEEIVLGYLKSIFMF